MMENNQASLGKVAAELNTELLETAVSYEGEDQEGMDTEQEIIYQKMLNLMKCTRCMTACNDKLEMYKQVTKEFTKLSGYKDADKLTEECKQLVKQTKKDIKKAIYKRALNKKKTAKLMEDYKAAAEEFRKINGYRDADAMALECEKLSSRIEKKAIRKRIINFAVVLICVAGVVLAATAAHTKYYLAGVYRITNSYASAIHMYQKLDGYKDSEERLIECQYQYGITLNETGDYKNAAKAFAAADGYKDSEEQAVQMEKQVIRNSQIGDTVTIGDYKWEILEVKNNQAFLMKKSAMEKMPYHDTAEGVTWEKSTLRQWLNFDFLNDTFTEAEKSNMIQRKIENIDNAVYRTDAGNDTQDYIFLLSIGEAEKYKSLFPDFESNSWLRSPGNSPSSAAFLSMDGIVMDYGYIVTGREMKVRPAMWFDIQ